MESMELSLQRVVTDLTEIKVGIEPKVDLQQEFSEFKDRWQSDSPDVQNLKASLEKLKASLGGLTGMLSAAPDNVIASEVEIEVVTEISDKPIVVEAQHIETSIKPTVKIVRVQDQDESDAGINMGVTKTNPLPSMWQGQTVGVKSRQENPDDGLPAVRFAIGDKIMDKK